jgi:hypothetical protein
MKNIDDGSQDCNCPKFFHALLKNKNDAIAVSKYAASHDGGYGNVCIMSSDNPVTHEDHYDWILG